MNHKNACLQICLYVGFFFFAAHADAQVRKISGKVSAEDDDNSLVGVSILVKGKNVATLLFNFSPFKKISRTYKIIL